MNAYQNTLDQEVLCAEPLELVVMLNAALRDAIREARLRLAQADVAGRSRAISRAMEIVGELASSLDQQRGGDLAIELRRLYAFMSESLLDGNYRQADAPLEAAERVACTLLEAWQELRGQVQGQVPAGGFVYEAAGFDAASSLCLTA